MPKVRAAPRSDPPDYLRLVDEMHTWKLPDDDILPLQPVPGAEPDGLNAAREYRSVMAHARRSSASGCPRISS